MNLLYKTNIFHWIMTGVIADDSSWFIGFSKSQNCQHNDVKVLLVEKDKELPAVGYCNGCNERVKSQILWDLEDT